MDDTHHDTLKAQSMETVVRGQSLQNHAVDTILYVSASVPTPMFSDTIIILSTEIRISSPMIYKRGKEVTPVTVNA